MANFPSLSPTKPNNEEDLVRGVDYPSLSPTKPFCERGVEKEPDYPSLSPTEPNNEGGVEKEADYPSLSPTKPFCERGVEKEPDYPSLSPTEPNNEGGVEKEADCSSLSPAEHNNKGHVEKEANFALSTEPNNEGDVEKEADDYPSLSQTEPNNKDDIEKEADYPSLSLTKPKNDGDVKKETDHLSLSPTEPNKEEADLEKVADSPSLSPTKPNNEEADKEKEADFPSLSPTKPNNEELAKARVREIVSSLPKAMGWATQYLYQYQGFWHSYASLEGIIYAQQNLKSQEGDILVATSLKCGTTWLKALVFSIKNREIYGQISSGSTEKMQHPLLTNHPHALVRGLDYLSSQKYSIETLSSSQNLFGTHMSYKSLPESIRSSGCRIVYMCRDPKDVFVSMWKFYNNVNKDSPPLPLQHAFELFCNGVSLSGPNWDHVLEYFKASLEWPEKVLFLKYEEMQSDTLNCVKRMAEFIGYPFSVEEEAKGVVQEIIELCSFKNMSNLEVVKSGKLFGQIKNDVWFRKGKVGDSKACLTPEMMDRLDKITKEKFIGFEIGY